MAVGDRYTEADIDLELDKQLPGVNKGSSLPIPKELMKALFMTENMGPSGAVTYKNAVSPMGATGVSQVMPGTVQGLIKNKLLPADFAYDPNTATLGQQVQAGIAVVRDFVNRYKTTDPLKIGALYNSGDPGASRYLKTGNTATLPSETQLYLPKMEQAYKQMGIPISPSPANVRADPAVSTPPLAAAYAAAPNMDLVNEVLQHLFGENRAAQESRKIQAASITAAADAAAESARLQAESTLASDAIVQELLRKTGLDINDPASALNQELNRSATARKQREDLGKQIADVQSRSLFADPLGWMQGLIELPQLIPQYNRLATMENSADAEITRMQSVAASVKSLTPARSIDLARAKTAADARALAENAKFQVAQLDEKNAAGNAKLFLDGLSLQRNYFSDMMQLESRNFMMEQREQGMKMRKEEAEAKAEKAARESVRMTLINQYRRVIAGNVPDLTIDDYTKMPQEHKAAWDAVVLRGGFGNYQGTTDFIDEYGNPSGAANAGNASMMQLNRNIKQMARTRAVELQNGHNSKNPLAKMTDKQAMAAAYDSLYNEHAAYAAKGADKSIMPPSNPYSINYDAAAASALANPAKQSTIGKILAEEKTKNPYNDLNAVVGPAWVVDRVEAQVKAGAVTPAKAAEELSIFFKVNSDNTYNDNGLRYFGLPKMQDFVVKTGAIGKNKIDLFNQVAIEHYFNSQVTAQKRRNEAVAAGVHFPFGIDPLGINK